MANIKREERVNDDDDVRAFLLCHHFESYYMRLKKLLDELRDIYDEIFGLKR